MNAIALGARRGWVVALIAVTIVLSTLALVRPAPTAAQDEELPKITIWGWPTTMLGFFDTEEDTSPAASRRSSASTPRSCHRAERDGPKLKAALPANQGPDICSPTSTS